MSKDIQALLPFYVNGSLSDKEKTLVEAAIKSDPSLKDEIAFLQSLRGEIQSMEFENSPGELGLKRLQKSLQAEKLKNDPIARAKSKITREQNWAWRAAAIAACLLLLVQTIVTLPYWKSSDLVAAGGGQVVHVDGQIISITFVPEAQEENIRQLLLSIDASIVDGPSALGVYKLSVPKDAEAAVEKLRARKNLVESADLDGRKAGQ